MFSFSVEAVEAATKLPNILDIAPDLPPKEAVLALELRLILIFAWVA